MIRFILLGTAFAAGALAGEWACFQPLAHRLAGRIFHRGELVALVHDSGIFRVDLDHARAAWQYRHGDDGVQVSDRELLEELTAGIALRRQTHRAQSVAKEFAALRGQFAERFPGALARDGLSEGPLRRMLADTISEADAIDNEISARIRVPDREVETFYREHSADFVVPLRLRVRHVFLAAPAGYPPEVFAEKKAAVAWAQAQLDGGRISPRLPPSYRKMMRQNPVVAISECFPVIGLRLNFLRLWQNFRCMPHRPW